MRGLGVRFRLIKPWARGVWLGGLSARLSSRTHSGESVQGFVRYAGCGYCVGLMPSPPVCSRYIWWWDGFAVILFFENPLKTHQPFFSRRQIHLNTDITRQRPNPAWLKKQPVVRSLQIGTSNPIRALHKKAQTVCSAFKVTKVSELIFPSAYQTNREKGDNRRGSRSRIHVAGLPNRRRGNGFCHTLKSLRSRSTKDKTSVLCALHAPPVARRRSSGELVLFQTREPLGRVINTSKERLFTLRAGSSDRSDVPQSVKQ